MKENQYTEFKESWHNEYIRYIYAFCNTDGGSLYIGINDRGEVIGLQYPEKLLEKLPNFIVQKTVIQISSRPYNKLIADVFYKAGFIESWI